MKRISVMIGVVGLALASLIYGSRQGPTRQTPPSAKQLADRQRALERTITTQQRLNRYFHGDVVPKLRDCWSRLQGRGTVGLKYTFTKAASGRWVFEKLEVDGSTLPRGQEAAALKCMQDSVRATSFPAAEGEGARNSFVLTWTWPVPFPANAAEQTSAMFAARANNGAGGGGGCDGHGAAAKCVASCDIANYKATCPGGKVCVGFDSCAVTAYGCKLGADCASGGPFGVGGGGIFAAENLVPPPATTER